VGCRGVLFKRAELSLCEGGLDLAQDRFDDGAFLAALESFNDWQAQNKPTKK
jgi:hypothetical protein